MVDTVQQQAQMDDAVERSLVIAQTVQDLILGLEQVREALDQQIRCVCDIAVPKDQEEAKRQHITAARALLANMDRALQVLR